MLLLLLLLLLVLLGDAEARCWLDDCTPNPDANYGCGAPPGITAARLSCRYSSNA